MFKISTSNERYETSTNQIDKDVRSTRQPYTSPMLRVLDVTEKTNGKTGGGGETTFNFAGPS